MSKFLPFAGAAIVAMTTAALAQEPPATESKQESTQATFLITGLHCPPCTTTVEASLRKLDGVVAVKVDWKTKSARVEFDEAVAPAQRIAQWIGETPHMMGRSMHYGGWLALKVPALRDDEKGKQIKELLSKLRGVKQVALYPAQHAIGIAFDAKGELTSEELIAVLAKAEIEAENY